MWRRFTALLLCLSLLTGATFTWTNPTTRTDGSELTNLAGTRLKCGPQSGGPYSLLADVPAPGASHEEPNANVEGKWCVATAYDADDFESAFSNEASLGSSPPPSVQDLTVQLRQHEAPVMPEPTLADYQQSNWADITNAPEVTPTVTWLAGDLILVVGATEDSSVALNTPTATGLTFSLVTSTGGAGNTNTYLWQATAAADGSSAITATEVGSSAAHGIAAFVYRDSDGLGNNATLVGSTAKTISLVRGSDNSAVIIVLADWNAVNDTTVNPSPAGGTERVAAFINGRVTSFVFNWGDQGAAGTTSYGITDHTGTVNMSGIVVEVKGAAAGGISGAGNIGSGEAFGTAKVSGQVAPAAIGSGEAFGADRLVAVLQPAAIASGEALGSPKLVGIVAVSGIASAEAHGAASLAGAGTLSPDGIASAEAFGSPLLRAILLPAGIASAEAHGTPGVAGAGTIAPSGIPSGEAFGSARLLAFIVPSAVASGEVFGSPTLSLHSFLLPSGIPTGEVVSSPALAAILVSVGGIPSAEAVGLARMVAVLVPTGITSAEALGLARFVGSIAPGGIASAEAIGLLKVEGFVAELGDVLIATLTALLPRRTVVAVGHERTVVSLLPRRTVERVP